MILCCSLGCVWKLGVWNKAKRGHVFYTLFWECQGKTSFLNVLPRTTEGLGLTHICSCANILQLTSVYQFLWLFSLFTYLSPIFLNWPFKSSPNLHYLSFTHLTKSLIFVVCWLYSSHCSLFMLSLKFIHIWPQLIANLKLNIFIIFAELFCDLGNNNVSGLMTQVKSKI